MLHVRSDIFTRRTARGRRSDAGFRIYRTARVAATWARAMARKGCHARTVAMLDSHNTVVGHLIVTR